MNAYLYLAVFAQGLDAQMSGSLPDILCKEHFFSILSSTVEEESSQRRNVVVAGCVFLSVELKGSC